MPSGFDELFQEEPIGSDRVPHMIRGDAKPNWQEISAADRFIKFAERSKRIRQILVLPTSAERAGRYLRALVSISPKAVRNVVVLSGDSISFNNIYRDRKLSWNIMEYPVPLVFFCHRNPVDPVDKHAGFRVNGTRSRPWAVTGTVDLLFYRDVLEALVVAAYAENGMVSDADKFDERLQKLRWCQERVTRNAKGTPLFAERNRNRGTGEHIVSVMPHREGGVVLPYSTITVWSRNANTDSPRRWRQVKMLPKVSYQDWEGRSDSSFDDFIVTVK